jgi:hypothetical protein
MVGSNRFFRIQIDAEGAWAPPKRVNVSVTARPGGEHGGSKFPRLQKPE